MHWNRSKCFDIVAVSENIIRFVKGSKLYKTYKKFETDYCRYIIDINLNTYFEEEFSNWDDTNKSILDPGKHILREKVS